jgi:hypothetical protein
VSSVSVSMSCAPRRGKGRARMEVAPSRHATRATVRGTTTFPHLT